MTDNARLIEQIRTNHFERQGSCPGCRWSWPCDVARLANALEANEAENQQLKDHYQQAIKDLKEVRGTKPDEGEGQVAD